MKYVKRLLGIILIGLLIACLGYYLRLQSFVDFPPQGDTYDEVKAAFVGINLIKDGVPRSWSYFDAYKNVTEMEIRDTHFRIVEPYFDDPPLFALISGYYAIQKGMDTFASIDIGRLRFPMLRLGAVNIFLLFLLVFLLKGPVEATLASLLYATIPTFVLGSRLPIADNAVTTCALTALLLFIYYYKKGSLLGLVLASIVAASAFLMKNTGIFVSVSLIFLVLAIKRYRASAIIGVFLAISIGIWVWYGFHYDWNLFTTLISVYSGRELTGPTPIISLLDTFRISEKMMSTDGWIIWGWISVVAYSLLSIKNKGKEDILARLTFPIVLGSYLTFFFIMSGHVKGWYRLPFYPFLCWAIAAFFIEIVKNPRFLLGLFFLTIPVSSSYIYGTNEVKWGDFERRVNQIFAPLVIAPLLFNEIFKSKTLKSVCQIILISAYLFSILLNIRTILLFQEHFWY